MLVACVLLSSACAGGGQGERDEVARCTNGPLSDGTLARFSLDAPPVSATFRFCESRGKGGAELSLRGDPGELREYVESLGMAEAHFVALPPDAVDQISKAESLGGWTLSRGEEYLSDSSSREWNGECLIDYQAFVPVRKSWREVLIGINCDS